MSRFSTLALAICALSNSSMFAQSASVGLIEEPVIDTVPVVSPVADSTSSVQALLLHTPTSLSLLSQPDTGRRKAVTYSDWYSRRLTVHRYGSYAMLPLFVTQYLLGNKLLNQKEDLYAGTRTTPVDKNLRNKHAIVAGGVGALFVVNTTTGLWNLFESRHTVEGRKLRTIHALTMLAADAGFAYTGSLGSRTVNHGPPQARKHRNAALVSFGISTAGASLMWFRRD